MDFFDHEVTRILGWGFHAKVRQGTAPALPFDWVRDIEMETGHESPSRLEDLSVPLRPERQTESGGGFQPARGLSPAVPRV